MAGEYILPPGGRRLTQAEAQLLADKYTSSTNAEYDSKCYICRDPDFAQMGLPLCRTCDECSKRGKPLRPGHVPADDTICTICGTNEYETVEYEDYLAAEENK